MLLFGAVAGLWGSRGPERAACLRGWGCSRGCPAVCCCCDNCNSCKPCPEGAAHAVQLPFSLWLLSVAEHPPEQPTPAWPSAPLTSCLARLRTLQGTLCCHQLWRSWRPGLGQLDASHRRWAQPAVGGGLRVQFMPYQSMRSGAVALGCMRAHAVRTALVGAAHAACSTPWHAPLPRHPLAPRLPSCPPPPHPRANLSPPAPPHPSPFRTRAPTHPPTHVHTQYMGKLPFVPPQKHL